MKMSLLENDEGFAVLFEREEYELALELLQMISAQDGKSADYLIAMSNTLAEAIEKDSKPTLKLVH
jgi:hypothetical protein